MSPKYSSCITTSLPFKHKSAIQIAWCFLLILTFSYCSVDFENKQLFAEKGVMDLRTWDFTNNGPIDLNGEWEFYPNIFLTPETILLKKDDAFSGYIQVPSEWNNFTVNGKKIGSHGYATYSLKVLLPESNRAMQMKLFMDIGCAVRVYLNGVQILEDGKIGMDENSSISHNLPVYSEPLNPGNELHLLLLTSNFHHRKGGFTMPLRLGEQHHLLKERDMSIWYEVILFGMLISLAMYHILLYIFRKKDPSPLYFGLFCFMISMRLLLMGNRVIVNLFPNTPWPFFYRLEYIGYFSAVPLFVMFMRAVFPEDVNKYFEKAIVWISLIFMASLFFGTDFISRTLVPYHIVSVTAGAYAIYVMYLTIRNRREGAILFFFGWMCIYLALVNDVFHSLDIIHTFIAIPFSLLVFLFFQTALLSKRFTAAFDTVEKLSDELNQRNIYLENLDNIKDEFLSNTSHELRTPLNGIIGLADSLLHGAGGDLNEKISTNLNMIISSGKRLSNLINDILDYSKLKNNEIKLSLKAVNVNELCDLVISVHEIINRKKDLILRNDISKEIPLVYADQNRLEQIFYNLIGNAVKFTDKGLISVSATLENNHVVITVSDTGIGIPENKLEDIFRGFDQVDSSTERKYGGTGLGLSISRHLAKLHGGSLTVDSRLDEGSHFHLMLPVSPANAEKANVISPLNTDKNIIKDEFCSDKPFANSNGKKILIVDDEQINRQVLRDILEIQNFTVSEAKNGKEALACLDESRPDLVILDIMMPEINGFNVCREIRKKFSALELPVLFLTAKNLEKDLVIALESGGNDFITKPFSLPEFSARIQTQIQLTCIHESELELKKQIAEKEKLAEIGIMTSGIVHDFKNPLSAIKELTQIVINNPKEKDVSEILEWIYNSSARTLNMAQDIMDYSRTKIYINKSYISSKKLLEQGVNSVYPYIRKRKLQIYIKDDLKRDLYVDVDRMLRVIINILINAVEAGTSGIFIEIMAKIEQNQVVISIKDNGPGIPEDIQENIFKPYVTSGKLTGTGLGLAISKTIVEAHGGSLTFHSEKGIGTEFYIKIPLE